MNRLRTRGSGIDIERGGAAIAAAAGLGLAGSGTYLHLTLAAQLRAGACDGCSPWHPLFVVAPVVVGLALVLAGGYRLYRGD